MIAAAIRVLSSYVGRLQLFAINWRSVRLCLQSGHSSGMNCGGVYNRSRPVAVVRRSHFQYQRQPQKTGPVSLIPCRFLQDKGFRP